MADMGDDYIKRLRAQLGSLTTMRASEAKNQFGQALDSALSGRAVVITKHDTPKAILMSLEEFEAMTMRQRKLDTLSAEFDAMYQRMQTPESKAGVDKFLAATPKDLGAAAAEAAKATRRKK